jgi:hypothetical protein
MCNEPEHVTQTVLHQLVNLTFVLDHDLEQPPVSPTSNATDLGVVYATPAPMMPRLGAAGEEDESMPSDGCRVANNLRS